MANPTDSWRIKAKTFFTVRSFKRFSINENKVRKSQPENVNPSSSEEVEHITFNTYNYNKNKRPNSYYTMKKLLDQFAPMNGEDYILQNKNCSPPQSPPPSSMKKYTQSEKYNKKPSIVHFFDKENMESPKLAPKAAPLVHTCSPATCTTSKVFRKSVIEGFLKMGTPRNQRFVVVVGKNIGVYLTEERKKIIHEIPIKTIINIEIISSSNKAFAIETAEKKFTFYAPSRQIRAEWLLALDSIALQDDLRIQLSRNIKKNLLKYLFKELCDEGTIVSPKSGKEWKYSPDGSLLHSESGFNCGWNGEMFVPLPPAQCFILQNNLGYGKWNGSFANWFESVGNPTPSLSFFYDRQNGEFKLVSSSDEQTNLNASVKIWNNTSQILSCFCGEDEEWKVSGSVPFPVVFFLHILTNYKLNNNAF